MRCLCFLVAAVFAQGAFGEAFPSAVFAEADSAAVRLEGRASDSVLELEGGEGVVLEGGRITSDTVWKCDDVHVVRNEIVVPSGVTLTVEGGTVLKFLPETGVRVENGGTLVLAGDEDAEIVLTSVSDDTVGGDTDGKAVAPVFGNYRIYVVSGGTLTDTHAQFRYGRSETFPTATVPGKAVTRHDCGIVRIPILVSGTRTTPFSVDWVAEDGAAKLGADYQLASGRIEWNASSEGWKVIEIPLNRCAALEPNMRFAVRLIQGGGMNLDPDAVLCDVIFYETNPTTSAQGGVGKTFPDAAFAEADSAVIRLEGRASDSVLELEGGEGVAVEGGRIVTDTVWMCDDVHVVRNEIVVPSGVTLTVEPGTVIKFLPETGIRVEYGGTLVLAGNEGAEIVLTSVSDDTVGGDTDGKAVAPVFGNYRIYVVSGGTLTDTHAQFRYGRGETFPTATVPVKALGRHDDGVVRIPVLVSGTRTTPFSVDWIAEEGTAKQDEDYRLASGRIEWNSSSEGWKVIEIPLNRFAERKANARFTVHLKQGGGINLDPSAVTCDVILYETNPTTTGDNAPVASSEWSSCAPLDSWVETGWVPFEGEVRVAYSSLWNGGDDPVEVLDVDPRGKANVLQSVPAPCEGAFSFDPNGLEDGRHLLSCGTNEVLFVLNRDLIVHDGALAADETWDSDKVHLVRSSVIVPDGVTLTISPNAIVKFMPGTGIDVDEGGLGVGMGAVFTHAHDDTIGGDTFFDGDATVPTDGEYALTGDWEYDEATQFRYEKPIEAGGNLTGENRWRGYKTYRIGNDITLVSGATLDIEAGAILKFDEGRSLRVDSGATLNVHGRRAAPVVFTSIRDDAHGGDTNQDGNETLPQAGDWSTIAVKGGVANFEFAQILYSSKNNTTGAISMTGGKVSFADGLIAHGLHDAVGVESGDFSITNSVIVDCLQAFRHWARKPIVNCVVYDCGRLTQGGGQHFVNCVFSKITETWEAFSLHYNGTTYTNCCFWNEGGSVLTAEGTQDAMTICGKDGNIWGDPLFEDPEAGNFRLRDRSPCIDAGDGACAPERDTFGNPRQTIAWIAPSGVPNANGVYPDIGVHEYQPREVSSDVDLTASSLDVPAEVTVGMPVTVVWQVSNEGSAAAVGAWTDRIQFVDATGKAWIVAESEVRNGLAAGGVSRRSKTFPMPSVPPGTGRFRIVVNVDRGVFEGSQTENNVLDADADTDASLATVGCDGTASVSIVGKGTFAAVLADGVATVRIPASEAEQTLSLRIRDVQSGTETVAESVKLSDGSRVVSLPLDCGEDVEVTVVVVNGSPADVSLEMETEAWGTFVDEATPDSVPNSSPAVVTLSGTCLDAVSEASLDDVPAEIVAVGPNQLTVRVDARGMEPGEHVLTLRTDCSSDALTCPIAVYKTTKGPKLKLEFEAPQQIRAGRRYVGWLKYSNVGDEDMPAPCLAIEAEGAMLAFGDLGSLKKLTFLAIGRSEPYSVLKAGESVTRQFYYTPSGKVDFKYGVTDETGEWAETCAAMRRAADVLNRRGREVYDLCSLTIYAGELGEDPSHANAVCGTVKDGGVARSGVEVLARAADGTVLARDVSDENGRYVLSGVASGQVAVVEAFGELHRMPKGVRVVGGDVLGVDLNVVPKPRFSIRLKGLPPGIDADGWCVVQDDLFDGGEVASGVVNNGSATIVGGTLSAGDLVLVKVCLCCGIEVEKCLELGEFGGNDGLDLGSYEIECSKGSALKAVALDSTGTPAADACVFLRHAETGEQYVLTTTSGGVCCFNGLKPGPYVAVATSGGCGVSDARFVTVPENGMASCELSFPDTVASASVNGTYSGDAEQTMVMLVMSGGQCSRFGGVDENGRYEVKGLEPGTYAIWACDTKLYLRSEIGTISVSAGETARYDFAKAPTASVTGQLKTTPAADAIEAGTLFLAAAKGSSHCVEVGADGSFRFDVPVGSYRIRAIAAGCVADAGCVELLPGAQVLNLTLAKGGTVCAELPAEVVSNGCAATVLRDGVFYQKVYVQDGSSLSFGPAEPGNYRLFVADEAGCRMSEEVELTSGAAVTLPMTVCSRMLKLNLVGNANDIGLVNKVRVECLDDSGIDFLLDFDPSSDGVLKGLPDGPIRVSAMRGARRRLGRTDVAADATVAEVPVTPAGLLAGTFGFGSRCLTLDFNYEDGRACSEILNAPCGECHVADVPTGYSSVTVRDDAGNFATLFAEEFEASGRTVRLDALATCPLRVRVSSDAAGEKPLFGVLVRLYDATSNCVEKATDCWGDAMFRVRAGTYSVRVTDDSDERVVENITVEQAVELVCPLEGVPRHSADWISVTRPVSSTASGFAVRNRAHRLTSASSPLAIDTSSPDWWVPPDFPKPQNEMTYQDLLGYMDEFDQRARLMVKPAVPCESDKNNNIFMAYQDAFDNFTNALEIARLGAKNRHRAFWNFTWGASLKAVGYVPGLNVWASSAAALIDTVRGMYYAVDPMALEERCDTIKVFSEVRAGYFTDAALADRIAKCGQTSGLCASSFLNDIDRYQKLKAEVDAMKKRYGSTTTKDFNGGNYTKQETLYNNFKAKEKEVAKLENSLESRCKIFGYDEKLITEGTDAIRAGMKANTIADVKLLRNLHISNGTALRFAKVLPWGVNAFSLHCDLEAINEDKEKLFKTETDFFGKYYPYMYDAYMNLVRAYAKKYADCGDGTFSQTWLANSNILTSDDPNEIDGPTGRGEMRCVGEGDTLVYTVYFENKATADVAAQEIRVTNPLDAAFDWSTLSVREVAFRNQTDTGLAGKCRGASEVALKDTSYRVRTEMTLDEATGVAEWYIRIVDKTTPDGWPKDVYAGVLPPNDAAHNGEGHITYSIRLRDGLASGRVVENKASIVFDTNEAIVTDPAWRNTLASVVGLTDAGRRMTVTVNPNWQKNHLGAGASAAQVASALAEDAKNGLKVWQCLALGLDPEDAADQFLVDVPQNDDPETIAVRALFGKTVGCWVPAVTFRLDGGASQESSAFGIDIGGETDPTGIYRVKAVFADDEGDDFAEVPAANQIGILRKTAANRREIVPVPWTKFAAGAEDIAVSNLVKTAGLTAGDKLYVYDDSAKRYATWELQSDKTWKPVKTVKMVNGKLEVQTADSPEVATVKRGSGVWLERHDLNTPITLVGQHEATLSEIEIAQGTTEAPNWNLVANPAISNWNLNAICEGVAVTDRIIVPTGGEPRIYTRDDANARWGYIRNDVFKNSAGIEIVRPTRVEDDVEIPAGTGFWYVSEGGSPVIKW